MSKYLALVAICLVHIGTAGAVTLNKYPCSPMFIAGPQGRPLPAAIVSVTDLAGAPVTVYRDTQGNSFDGVVPVTQILQFFVDIADTYIVTVSSSGINKQYWATCAEGLSASLRQVSIDRTAEVMLNTWATSPPNLICPDGGFPCYYPMPHGQTSTVSFDFIMPSFALVLKDVLVSWWAAGLGTAHFHLDWCAYKVGELPCAPSGAHSTTIILSPADDAVLGGRNDFLVLGTSWTTGWVPRDHVVVVIARDSFDPPDPLMVDANLENVRMEFTR